MASRLRIRPLLLVAVAMAPAFAEDAASFNLPSQPLAESLKALGMQTKINVMVRPQLVDGVEAPAVKAQLTTREVLSELLSGTDLEFRFINDETVVIREKKAVEDAVPMSRLSSGAHFSEENYGASASGDAWQLLRLAQSDIQRNSENAAGPQAATGFSSGTGKSKVEEVIVTATRRSQGILETPLSIAALNTDDLIKSNVKSIKDLSTLVPGIDFQSSMPISSGWTNIAIRGIVSSGGAQTTGLYMDEVPIQGGTTAGNQMIYGTVLPAVFDLDRVEVLRGPQGTLFGASTMGGAVRFIQNQPGLQKFSGRATGELGFTERGGTTYEAGAAFGGPIVEDKLGFRLSLWQRRDGGYVDRIEPIQARVADRDANSMRTSVGRLAMTWAPSETIKITPSFYWQALEKNGEDTFHVAISDSGTGDFRNGSFAGLPHRDRFYVPSLTLEADLGFADFIAISSWIRRTAKTYYDLSASFGARGEAFGFPEGFGNPLGTGFVGSADDWDVQITELKFRQSAYEMRLSSRDPDARLAWTVGAFYGSYHQFDGHTWSSVPFEAFEYTGGEVSVEQKDLSGFAQFDLRLLERLKATAGVRVARIEVDLRTAQSSGEALAEGTAQTVVSSKFGLEYQFTSRNMVYASAAEGFRAGGVNLGLVQTEACQEQANPGYGSDSLWSYEIGTKHRLFGDRATFTASAYRIEWSDIQTPWDIPACASAPTVNAGSVTVKGFDAAVSVLLLPPLRLDFSVANIEAKFDQDLVSPAGNLVALAGYSLTASSSPWTMTGSLEYSFEVRGRDAFVRAENIYRTRNSGPFLFQAPAHTSYNPDLKPNPSWNMLNLRTGITIDNFQVAAFMTNALDTRPAFHMTNTMPTGTFFFASTVTPRTVGINLNYNFE